MGTVPSHLRRALLVFATVLVLAAPAGSAASRPRPRVHKPSLIHQLIRLILESPSIPPGFLIAHVAQIAR